MFDTYYILAVTLLIAECAAVAWEIGLLRIYHKEDKMWKEKIK